MAETQQRDPVEIIEELGLANIMRDKHSRAFILSALTQCGIFVDGFDADPYLHARKSGMRSIGLWLQSELMRVTPINYMNMIKEGEEW